MLMISLKKLQSRQERFNTEGSITIFLALTLVLILSFLFSMVEVARVNGLRELSKRKLALQTESLQGAYNQELWEHYRLLFLDMSYGSGEPDARLLEEYMMEEEDSEGREQHFYQIELKDAEVESYTLATDRQGEALKRQACYVVKNTETLEGAGVLEGQMEDWKMLEQTNSNLEKKWEDALAAEEEAQGFGDTEKNEKGEMEGEIKCMETERSQAEKITGTEGVSREYLPESPIHYVAQLKTTPILALVLEQPLELSGKAVPVESALYNRTLHCGNSVSEQVGNVDKMCFVQYLNQYFSCKTNIWEQGHALDYELEYCIAGKSTDAENLEEVVKKLLQLRESANFMTIMQDAQKQSFAMDLAVAAVGFTGLTSLIKAVQIGILLAWSYVESITDLKSLLSGGKVPLRKNSSQWKSDLFHIEETVERSNTTGQEGMSYPEYLKILLFLTGEETITNRAMDVIERNIRLFSGNEAMRMDTMAASVSIRSVYTASPLFLNVVSMVRKIDGVYQFTESRKFAY